MAYCTIALVRESLGGISEAELPDPHIQDSIDEADSKIDSYIAVKYALPLPLPVPKMIQRISRNIAACQCWQDVIASGVSMSDQPKIKSKCERAEETLENLRNGKQQLIDDDGKPVPPNTDSSSLPWSSTNAYNKPQFFDVDDDTQWQFPSQMKTDIADDRDD